MVVPESSINNIMGGLESTGGVRLHNHRRKLKQRFDIVKKLGQGTYGKVQLGINKETGQEVAIKTIKKCKIETEADLIRIRREIQIMSSVQHPNIIHIYEVFENREKMVLVMEYAAGGELYDFLSERKVLAEEEARRIFRQIATAVYYCHKHKICHRDLKLENILLDENGNAKIADFGLSNVFDESRLLGTFCGSPLYASPEIVKGTPYHGPEVDCCIQNNTDWLPNGLQDIMMFYDCDEMFANRPMGLLMSLGVLLYTLVYGAMPFDGSNFKRLVRQISQGDYFEPKKPSPASALIRDMLNIDPGRRADITAVCSHWWLDAGQSAPCLTEAEELACLTPVRLDLLLCLAPPTAPTTDSLLVSDQPASENADRPLRSQSLSSLATSTVQPDFLPDATVAATPTQARRDSESRSKRKEEGGSVKRKDRSRSRRERSSSRNRRDESTPEPDTVSEKPKRKSVKAKKTSSEPLVLEEPKAEELLQPKITDVEEELITSSETILAPRTPVDEVPKEKSPVPSDVVEIEELKSREEENPEEPVTPVAETPKQPSPVPAPTLTKKATPPPVTEKVDEKLSEEDMPKKPMERRKSKIFETAEKFNKIGTAEVQQKPQPKKVVLPGVKVSDAKKAYERRSSLASSTNFIRGSASRKSLSGESSTSPQPVEDTKFSLASSVALNKLVENVERLSKLEDEKEMVKSLGKSEDNKATEEPAKPNQEKVIEVKAEETKGELPKGEDETRKKVKNAVQVIGNAITEGISGGETKSATLPRRKTSRAEIKLAMPASKPPEFRSEVEHMVGTPVSVQRSEVKFPVSAPSPVVRPAVRQGSSPREYIVPIQVEQEASAVKPPPPPTQVQRPVSRTSSKSLSRQSTLDSDLGSTASMGEPIRKSPREVIIPIAVEGGGFVTPSADAISRVSSVNESEDDLPRGFGLHSARRRQLETADSVSSDEDDDNFEILTAENLFSTLLSRVRSLTQRLNTEDRQTFPRLFNHHHSIFDIPPSRRLTEARSFGRADSVPWRRSMSRESGGLPRDGSVSRIGTPQRTTSLKSSGKDKPPPYRSTTARQPPLHNTEPTNPSSEGGELHIATDQHDKSSETAPANYIRGIPTAEIVGSSIKKLPRSESKTSKISKLPRSATKSSHEPVVKNDYKDSGVNNTSDSVGEQTPRRNSLERPSFYNSLYKSGLRSYNGSMTRSLNLPADHSFNGDPISDPTAAMSNEQFNKLDQYLASRHDNGDSSASEYDYHSIRPYSTLGRTLSLRGPKSNKLYPPEKSSLDSDIETKYRRSPTRNVAKGSSQFSSRFLRPKSFYGVTNLPDYQAAVPSMSKTEIGKPISDLQSSDGRSAFVGRRSPSYQRSISLFEGKKADDYRSSVTPDRLVLSKFFSDKKYEKESEKPKKTESTEIPKVRKHSRFLRPDFYDTPKEDSVYEKKEKVKNPLSNGGIWKEKDKTSSIKHKKSSKKDDSKNQENRLSIVDKAIKSLKENTLGKIDRESMARESNLIKRAVSLEDCSLVPENRSRRSTSLTPQSDLDNKRNTTKFDKMFQKKKVEDFKKIVDYKLNYQDKDLSSLKSHLQKPESVIKKIVRKVSPKSLKLKLLNNNDESVTCNGSLENNSEEAGVSGPEVRSRLSRIAGLKRLEFSRPLPSADSTPSMEEGRFNGEFDDSSSILSPTEDGSDTWSISSDYADARDFIPTPTTEDSVSERIRRKSFYSRFNQSKRRKSSSQSSQLNGSRSRLPMYTKSMSSDFTPNGSQNKPIRKISDPDNPIDN